MASVFWWLVRPGSSGNPMVLSPRLCRQKAVEALMLWLLPTVPCLLELTWVLPGQGSRVKGHCSWKGGREWSGMLALWLNWALGIPGSFTEWPVSATETRRERFAFQPQELPGPTGCCGNMANFW